MKYLYSILILYAFIQEAFAVSDCPNGYKYLSNVYASAFMAPVSNACSVFGYTEITIPDGFLPILDGFTSGAAVALCDGFLSDGLCERYTKGDCIENYYEIPPNSDSITQPTNGKCSSTYSTFTKATRCDRNPGDICLDLPTPEIQITWNYNDGTGATSASSCFLEDLIELPQTPTRQGYVFGGWRVKNNQ